ncbi:FGLLP motif-containing membrane protein [Yinghuangia soli]|uniref:IPT/TIG domain-containing protein n=1 Tax=Yinghuangia soli TaxID=2908204 RepID=A0AA41U1H9_9ACTN|nr:FGLLP motif-containing membrane protein [Yinghuangia soli]MCF2526154.1 hypothetical protein [Yinghuangia soli]
MAPTNSPPARRLLAACLLGAAGVLAAVAAPSAAADGSILNPSARVSVSPQSPAAGDVLEIRGTGMRGCASGTVDVHLAFDPGGGNMGPTTELIAAALPVNDANGHAFTLHHKVAETWANEVRVFCHGARSGPVTAPLESEVDPRASGPVSPTDRAPVPTPDRPLPPNAATVLPASGPPGSTAIVWVTAECASDGSMASLRRSDDLRWDGADFGADDIVMPGEGLPDGVERAMVITVPVDGMRGPRTISVGCDRATGSSEVSPGELTTTFTVSPAELTVTPARAAPGDRIRVAGRYFTGCADALPGRPAELSLRHGGREIGRVPVAPDGGFAGDLVLPADLTGAAPLTAGCTAERFDGTARTEFTLTGAASATGAPNTAPGPDGTAAPASGRSASALALPQPGDLFDDPEPVAAAAASAVLALPIIGMGAELFNRTVEGNRDRIYRFVHPGGRRRHLPRHPRLAFVVFAVLSSLFALAAEPWTGFDRATLTLGLALSIAVPLGAVAYGGSAEAYRGRVSRLPSVPSVIWGALGAAAVVAAVSRLAGLTPGYVFGLILSFTAVYARNLTIAQQGRAVAIGAGVLTLLAGAAWAIRIPVRAAADGSTHPGFGLLLTEDILTQTFVAGVTGLVFGLLPLRGLDGGQLWGWSRTAWSFTYAMAAFLFVLALTDPAGATDGGSRVMLMRAAVVFGVFFAGSLAFWAWFRFRPDPHAPRPDPLDPAL